MAKGDWWFKFEHLKWLTDEQLNRCSLETQGFWIRCICVMRKSGTAKISGTGPELCRLLSATGGELKRCFAELLETKAANVTLSHASVTQKSVVFTIMSRKITRELKIKEQNRLRKERERRHAKVTDESRDRVKSNKKEVISKKEEEVVVATTKPKLSDAEWLDSLQQKSIYSKIDVKNEYERAEIWAETNNRKVTRRFFVGWLNRAKPMDVTKQSATTNGDDPTTDIMSPHYVMPRARLDFSDAAESYFNTHDDGTQEEYEQMKLNWLGTAWAKGFEHEVEEYERTYKFRKRFGEENAQHQTTN
jgi:hypothetical protein